MCENASWQSILTIFATLGKKKGVNQLCCYLTVSPNTCIHTTAKPTPLIFIVPT